MQSCPLTVISKDGRIIIDVDASRLTGDNINHDDVKKFVTSYLEKANTGHDFCMQCQPECPNSCLACVQAIIKSFDK